MKVLPKGVVDFMMADISDSLIRYSPRGMKRFDGRVGDHNTPGAKIGVTSSVKLEEPNSSKVKSEPTAGEQPPQ